MKNVDVGEPGEDATLAHFCGAAFSKLGFVFVCPFRLQGNGQVEFGDVGGLYDIVAAVGIDVGRGYDENSAESKC